MAYISLELYKHVHNIHLEGTLSQIFYLELSFDFILKTGNFSEIILHSLSIGLLQYTGERFPNFVGC